MVLVCRAAMNEMGELIDSHVSVLTSVKKKKKMMRT